MAGEIFLQGRVILGPAVGAADGIDVDGQALEAQIAQDAKQGADELRLHHGRLAAKAFHAKLVMLPQASRLGLLIAENRGVEIIHLAGQGIGEQMILDQRAHSPCRALGLERDAAVSLVLEGVHFLLHDVGGIPHTPQEKLGMLKNGRADLPIARQRGPAPHDALDGLPDMRVLRQHIPGALGRLCQQCDPLLMK